jgi:acetyl esterase/lipase
VDPDGTVHIANLGLPWSIFASPEGKANYIASLAHPRLNPGNIQEFRRIMDELLFIPQLKSLKARYPVDVEHKVIAGVPTDIITPKGGVPERNRRRLLINVHGGGFSVGGGGISGQVEAIPIAARGGFEVMTIDYRMYPEAKFPAASEDAAAVYKELIKKYDPKNIAIYGSSAGAILSAQLVAWFQVHNLPRPGAIGIFAGSAGAIGEGDSGVIWPVITSQKRNFAPGEDASPKLEYLEGTDPKDPLVAPIFSPNVLEKFPPTLILTSSRALDASAAAYTDIQLTKVGVASEFHEWDGYGHGAFMLAGQPEADDAADIIVRFFDKHLGH